LLIALEIVISLFEASSLPHTPLYAPLLVLSYY
jgi:hypothetical protein